MSRKNSSSDGASSALAVVLLAIFALPIVGIYLMAKEDSGTKALGTVLTVVGVILWVVIAVSGS